MRNLFVGTIVLICLVIGLFYYIFYTPALILKYIPSIAEQYLKDATLNSINIGGQSFAYPETLKLFKVSAELEWKNEIYQIEAAEFNILNFQALVKNRKQAIISASGLTVQKKNFGLHHGALDLTVNFNGHSLVGYGGFLKNGELNLNPYQLTAAQAQFEGTTTSFKVSQIKAQAYGGRVGGEINMEQKPRSSETVSIEFTGLKSQELQTLNKTIFSQLTGDFSGTLKMSRIDQQLQLLVILAEMKKGGVLARSLGQKIAGYMTDEENRYAVESLLDTQGKIHFDHAEFRILNLSQNLAGVTVTLESKKDNFRIQETINIDIARILQKIAWKN